MPVVVGEAHIQQAAQAPAEHPVLVALVEVEMVAQ
jgi:hypothetical protein